jgi:putative membrane protein
MKKVISSLLPICMLLVLTSTGRAGDISNGYQPPKAGSHSPRNTSPNSSKTVTGKDLTFLNEAAPGGLMEVELGELAVKRASNADIRKFARRMIDDHSKANRELDELATKKNVTLKKEKTATQKAAIDKLSKLNGDAFDREYAKDMLKDHEEDVAKFEEAATTATDADVKKYAAKTLPTLREHLEMARKLLQADAATSKR